MPESDRSARIAGAAALWTAGSLLWLLNHPYHGVWHDALIYGLLAAKWLHPDALAPDLFFRYGSQGEFSLFTPLYGALTGWLGLDRASWWVVLTGGVAWIGAVMWLAHRLLGRGPAAGVAVLLAAAVTVSYSPNAATFVLTENFSTARSWALPLGLGGIAALLAGRRGWALALSLGALALHPLLGIWPLALCVLVWLPMRLAVWLVALAVGAGAALGMANVDLPYLRSMQGDWLLFARDRAPDILFRSTGSRLAECAALLAVLLLALRGGSETHRAFYGRVLLLGCGGLALALMASFWLPLEILVQGQPWRVCWLLLPLALCALLDVAQRLARESRSGVLLLCAIGVALTLEPAWWLPGAYLAAAAAFLPPAIWRRADAAVERRRKLLVAALAAAWLVLLPGWVADLEIAGRQMLMPWWAGADWLHGLVAGGGWHVALLAVVPALWRGRTLSAAWRFGLAAILLTASLFALSHWDRRPEAKRIEEACYLDRSCPPHPFLGEIAIGDTVFWLGREPTVWLALNRASYYGRIQHTGAVFSRQKFDEWARRDARVAASREPHWVCADPTLDWLVLAGEVSGAAPRAEAKESRPYHLYACADFRVGAVPSAPTLPR